MPDARQAAEEELRRRELAELRAELERSETQLARLPGVEVELHLLRRQLAAAQEELAEARRDREVLLAELAEARHALAAVEGSRAWRLTAPLRAARRSL